MSNKKLHKIKCTEPYFTQVKEGIKTFELRENDRDYQEGDFIELQRYIDFELTGERQMVEINYILEDYEVQGLEEGYCILGIEPLYERLEDIPQEPMNNIDFLKELGKFFVQMGKEYEASAFAVGVVEEMEEKGIEVDYEKLQ